MRRLFSLAMGLIVLVAVSGGALTARSEEPTPAAGPSEELLSLWNRTGELLIDMAEDFPEDKYGYKPNDEVRSFSEQLLHVAGANYYFLGQAGNEKSKPSHAGRETKADVVAVVKESFADGAAFIRQLGDEGMSGTVKHPFANKMISVQNLLTVAVGHGREHYGQLVVYYRNNGMVPPASRNQGN